MEDPHDHEPKRQQGMSFVSPHHDLNHWQSIYLLYGLRFSLPSLVQSIKVVPVSLPGPRFFLSLPNPSLAFHRLVPLLRRIHPIWYYIFYFLFLSVGGFLLLNLIPARNQAANLDIFFTVVSAVTSSSMATVEMESFSTGQLLAIALLMLLGGQVFTSMVDLHFRMIMICPKQAEKCLEVAAGEVELGLGTMNGALAGDVIGSKEPAAVWPVNESRDGMVTPSVTTTAVFFPDSKDPEHVSAAKCLLYVVMGYFVSLQFLGCLSVLSYLLLFRPAGDVLRNKHISLPTFSLFMAISTFANCGYVPNNEGMVAFQNNSGLLLVLSPLVLAGNTLFPPFLRLLLLGLRKFFPGSRGVQLEFLLTDGGAEAVEYPHLLSASRSQWLAATGAGFLLSQMALLCGMEWRPGGALAGMQGFYRKAVGAWFQSVNTRHTGEVVVDVSSLSPALLVLYVVMMYLPGYTSVRPYDDTSYQSLSREDGKRYTRRKVWRMLRLSHICYLSIFAILICITERKSMVEDPLNFSAFNIIFEVVSAYGNVGFTTGYSCQRRLTPDPSCQSPFYGFAGAWSAQGKLLLIAVMIFGRLKRLTKGGGKAWILE